MADQLRYEIIIVSRLEDGKGKCYLFFLRLRPQSLTPNLQKLHLERQDDP
jgi:hypothetical protein